METKSDVLFAKNVTYPDPLPKAFINELKILENFIEEDPKCLAEIKKYVTHFEEFSLSFWPRAGWFRMQKNRNFWPGTCWRYASISVEGLTQVHISTKKRRLAAAELEATKEYKIFIFS